MHTSWHAHTEVYHNILCGSKDPACVLIWEWALVWDTTVITFNAGMSHMLRRIFISSWLVSDVVASSGMIL